jgi:hypothetical protein
MVGLGPWEISHEERKKIEERAVDEVVGTVVDGKSNG